MTIYTNAIDEMEQRVSVLLDGNSLSERELVEKLYQELSTGLEELHVVDEELAAKAELIAALEAQEQEWRSRFGDQFDRAPEAYLETDRHGLVIQANLEARRLLDIEERFLNRKPLAAFVAEADRSAFRSFLNSRVDPARAQSYRTRLQPRSGPTFLAELFMVAPEEVGSHLLHWRIRDLSNEANDEKTVFEAGTPSNVARTAAEITMPDVSERDAVAALLRRVSGATATILGVPAATARLESDRQVAHTTAEFLVEIEELQSQSGAGPCFTALENRAMVITGQLTHDPRWPGLQVEAEKLGLNSALAVPMLIDDQLVGTLTAYSRKLDAFHPSQEEMMLTLASQAAFAVNLVRLYRATSEMTENVQRAMASRATIEQAKGILMLRHKCNSDEAFEILRRNSQTLNVKVNVLAANIVERSSNPNAVGKSESGGFDSIS